MNWLRQQCTQLLCLIDDDTSLLFEVHIRQWLCVYEYLLILLCNEPMSYTNKPLEFEEEKKVSHPIHPTPTVCVCVCVSHEN